MTPDQLANLSEEHQAAIMRRVAANRPRGVYFPTSEASLAIANGWMLLDDCPAMPGRTGTDEVLLLPPAAAMEAAE